MSHKTSETSQSLKTLHHSVPVDETIYRYIHVHVQEFSCKCTHRFPSSRAIVHFGRGFPVGFRCVWKCNCTVLCPNILRLIIAMPWFNLKDFPIHQYYLWKMFYEMYLYLCRFNRNIGYTIESNSITIPRTLH